MTDQKKLIVFVCTGNTCRSPMAEAIFKSMLTDSWLDDWYVCSRGISAYPGQPAAKNAVEVMREFGCDLSSHRAANLTDSELDAADIFICMTAEHAKILKMSGVNESKIEVLNVADPFGGNIETYRLTAAEIKRKLEVVYGNITK